VRVFAAALLILALAAALFAPRFSAAQAPGATAAPAPPPATLYQRLGGYDSLAVLTDDFVARLARDRSLARFFANVNDASKGRMRQLMLDQLCAASGGPCIYPGRDLKTAHQGLGIRESDWAATIGHLIASLDKYKVGPKEKDEVLQWVARLKRDIVEKP
jgi:hemoglobin